MITPQEVNDEFWWIYFWWVNDFNRVEYDGPFKSVDEAKKAANKAFEAIPGDGGSIIILKAVDHYDASQAGQNNDHIEQQ